MERYEIEDTFCEIANELILNMKKELIEEAIKNLNEKEKELVERKRSLFKALKSVEEYGLSNVKFEYGGETYDARSILKVAHDAHEAGKLAIYPHLYVLIEPEKKYLYIGPVRVSGDYDIETLEREVIKKIDSEINKIEDELMELTLASVANKEKVKELLILQDALSRVCRI